MRDAYQPSVKRVAPAIVRYTSTTIANATTPSHKSRTVADFRRCSVPPTTASASTTMMGTMTSR